MSKKNTKKNALLMSVMSLLLCVSMLVGTTFAWFTDEVESGMNTIAAGNLDIELYHTSASVTTEEAVNNGTTLFLDKEGNAIKWEPGVVAYENLRIANVGSLALKYELVMNFGSENSMVDGGYKLSQVLKIGMVPGGITATERADVVASVDAANWTTLADFVKNGELLPKGDEKANEAMGIVIWWEPSDIDNNWNANNGKETTDDKPLHIELGVKLTATQLMYEEDSFDNTYDEDALINGAVVTNDAELLAAIQDPSIKTIVIDENVTYNWGSQSYGNSQALLMKGKTIAGKDGNEVITFAGYGSANPIVDVTMRNLTVADNTVGDNEGAWEHGHLEFVGLNADNVVFANTIMLCGGDTMDATSVLTNCTMDNSIASWYGVWVDGGNAVIENCSFTGTRAVKIHEAYGSKVGSVTVNNSSFILSQKPGVVIGDLDADTTVSITNSIFFTTAGDQGKYVYESDTAVDAFAFSESGNTVPGATATEGLYQDENGIYYATTTNGLAKGVSVMSNGDTIVLADDIDYSTSQLALTKDVTVDLNGNTFTTTNARPVRLTNGASVKNGTLNVTTTVAAIVVGDANVGSIEDVTINVTTPAGKTTTGIQLFNGKHVDTIKNVTITGVTQGIEVANGSSVDLIENVHVEATRTGLQVQQSTIGQIKDSSFYGAENGVWAQLKGTNDLVLNFTNCQLSGDNYGLYMCDEGPNIVTVGVAKLTYDAATTFEGGIKDQEFAFGQSGKLYVNGAKVGAFIANAEELFAFAKAVNEEGKNFSGTTVFLTADIDLNNALWTPIGQTGATEFRGTFDGQGYTISNLNVDSSAQTGKHYSSGLFGWAESGVTIQNVKIDGAKVVGNHNVAVLVGYTYSGKISNCHVSNAQIVCNHANDDACGDKCGLIGGYVGNEARVSNCTGSNSTVTAGRDAGQLLGLGYNVSVSNCSADNVTVTATGACTGANINEAIIGRVMG